MDYIIVAILFVLILLPIPLIVIDGVTLLKKKERPIFELFAFFVGAIHMTLAIFIWELPDYQNPINLYGNAGIHEPFNHQYYMAIAVFALWGFFSYFILKFARRKLPPLVEVFLMSGTYVGCGLSIVWIFQLICGAHPEGREMGTGMTSWDVFVVFCLCIVPGLFLIHVIQMMMSLIREKARKQEELQYKNPVMQAVNVWFLKGANLFWAALIAVLPVLVILMILLTMFGQQPDSIILAFTQTSDWILSKEVAPPPMAWDTHYLCTVSLRGHKKLVKPIRYGIRRGEKIVVNRQLCIANAFEQFLMEKAPHFHKKIRHFYDTYGYPVSKHINHAWSADITYLIMKPFEWIFLVVLYLFDEKPETRICSQYLPMEKLRQFASDQSV